MKRFMVITKVPPPGNTGNLAFEMDLYVEEPGREPVHSGDKFGAGVFVFRTPVFFLGEILVVDEHGREIAGRGRKPSKWIVETESFETIEEAIQCSSRVSIEGNIGALLRAEREREDTF